jgi:hypothetical protein
LWKPDVQILFLEFCIKICDLILSLHNTQGCTWDRLLLWFTYCAVLYLDPMSPNNMLDPHGEAGGSPLTSPPATPLAVLIDSDVMSCQTVLGRRRTMSQSRWAKDRDRDRDEPRSNTPDSVIEVGVVISLTAVFALYPFLYTQVWGILPVLKYEITSLL